MGFENHFFFGGGQGTRFSTSDMAISQLVNIIKLLKWSGLNIIVLVFVMINNLCIFCIIKKRNRTFSSCIMLQLP